MKIKNKLIFSSLILTPLVITPVVLTTNQQLNKQDNKINTNDINNFKSYINNQNLLSNNDEKIDSEINDNSQETTDINTSINYQQDRILFYTMIGFMSFAILLLSVLIPTKIYLDKKHQNKYKWKPNETSF